MPAIGRIQTLVMPDLIRHPWLRRRHGSRIQFGMTMPERLFLVISPRSRFPFVSSEVETPIDTAPGARGVSASF
ncbi:MAG: hypothetical protein KYX64_12270, partial [Sphingopyxis sp.]|nr:hypothetical protein [Sphingopyxis sp.]